MFANILVDRKRYGSIVRVMSVAKALLKMMDEKELMDMYDGKSGCYIEKARHKEKLDKASEEFDNELSKAIERSVREVKNHG